MKKILLFLSLSMLLVFGLAAETTTLGGGSNSVTVLSSSGSETVLQYQIGRFEQTRVQIGGEDWYHINLPKEGITQDKGAPQLPVFNRSIIIDPTARMRLELLDAQYQDFPVAVAPSKGVITRDIDPDTVPYSFGDVYQRDGFYPQNVAELSEPYIMRDFRGIVVQTTPFAYNPKTKTLRVYTSYKVRVYASGQDTVNTLTTGRSSISRDFVSLYENRFLNWDSFRYTPVDDSFGKLLVICHTNYMSTILPYVNWKIQKGIPTELVQWSTIGTTAAQLQTYIQNRYNADSELTYVQLVGDAPQIPSLSSGGGGSDPTFSLVAGSDNYPDIFIGRFSAETTAQVTAQINKAIAYERDVTTSDTWLSRAMGIASAEGGGSQGDNGESDITHMNNIRTDLLGYGYTSVDQIYDPGASASTVTTNVNAGRGFINYVGHGADTYWVTTGFSNTNATALTNGSKTPFIMDVACVNGNFVSITCFAEAWQRNANGGSVAIYASSINQSWNSPMRAEDEVTDLLIAEAKYTVGGLYYNGSCEMMDVYGTDGVNMFKTWHIFGDASLSSRTKTPIAMNVTHPSNITSGTTSVSVSTGVNNTLVAITYNNVIYGRAFTNSSGNATITLTSPPTGVLNYTITATAHNRVTYVGTIAQTVASGPWMEVTAANFDDANNDVPEYNESGYFDVTFKNSGTSAASSVSATLSCATSGISVTDASHSISSLAAGASTTADNAYAITIANNVANGTVAEFTVIMTMSGYGPWTYNFSKTINAPALAFGNMTISDPSGDNDGLLDPGETATVSIVLNNSGAAASLAGTGTLSCGTSGITVVNGSASFSAISAGGYATLSFTVTAASSMTEGTLAAFVFNAVAGQYSANTTVNVEVGAPLQVIIGNGTSTQSYPIDRYYNYSGQEAIYLASEIGTPGTIKSIGFYKASGTDVNTIEAVTVYMKNTSSTTLSTGNYSTSGYTQVYSGTWPNTATSGWMEVNLQNQFAYDGSNLSILTIKGYQYWTSNYPMWTYTTSSATRARQNRSDDAQPTSLTASTNLPNLKLALYPSSGGTEPPTISVNDDSMYAYLQIGTTGTDSFTITNTGEQTLNYNIGIEELSGRDFTGLSSSKGEKDRSIAGSTLTVNATDYIPGSTANWTFTVTNNSTDNEWMQDVIISFPAGVTVNSATNFVGGNGGDMTPNVTSGNGVTITWHGETSYGYGVIYPDESASATVNVTIGAGFGGNLTLPWTLNGDVYGSDPHTLSGSIVLPSTGSPDPVWYSAAPLSGSIAAGQSETVTVYFSAEDMAAESYYADLTITSNAPLNPTLVVELQMDVWDEVVTDPLIAVNPASVSETAVEGNSTTATVTVTNPGTAALTWSTPSSFAAWGTVSPASGTVAAGGNTVLTLTLNAAALTAGSYNANMVISSNAANEPSLTVPVSLTVEAYVEPSDIRFIAEWEPATGTIIAYSGGFGLPYSMIADLSTRGEVYVLVTSSTQSTASSLLSSNGVTMSNVSFIVRDGVNTYWTRDYGPWSIFDANGEMAIVDFRYNRPRPYDNAVNAVLDDQFSFGYYYMPLVATGGNVMTDGQGKMMSTNLIQTENDGSYNPNVTEYDYTLAEIEDLVEDYLGVEQYFMYADPLSNSSIDHIDCHAKLLDVDKVMIARVPSGHANYTALENVVDYWETKTSSYGTPYQIFRVDQTSSNEPYSNAFVFNNKIYVPQWNSTASAADLAAVAAYQAAMPGYTVQGYYNSSWLSDDAVHCRVNTVFDEQMIHLAHVQPTSATANSNVT
ncbi:MAG TPA: C25 family cysteine peptidase, partial [Candidatus Syntrophosphaera sp.]|nr:C25 family cysteine peptidase [Candidatus Syntrophosphaera sp.]